MKYILLLMIITIDNLTYGQSLTPEDEASMTKFLQYFHKSYKHPESAKKSKIEGYFMTDIYINNDGQIVSDSIKVRSSVCKECDSLAIKILKETPKGITGHQNAWILNFGFLLSYRKVTVPSY